MMLYKYTVILSHNLKFHCRKVCFDIGRNKALFIMTASPNQRNVEIHSMIQNRHLGAKVTRTGRQQSFQTVKELVRGPSLRRGGC